jgi:hypothetical protein
MSILSLKDALRGGRAGRNLTDEQAALAKQLNEEAAENWGVQAWHREQAALIADAVDYGFRNDSIYGGVLRFHNLNREDKLIHKERRGIKVFTVAAGGYVEESTITVDSVEAPRSPMGWHVVGTEEDALADYAVAMSELVTLAKAAEEAEIVRRQLAMLKAAITSSSPYYVDATAGLTANLLTDALTGVADAERPTGGVLPTEITILGRAAAIEQVTALVTAGNYTADEEIRHQGFLGRYKGARVQRLLNFTDADGTSFTDEDELWVVADAAGDYARFGNARVKNWVEDSFDKVHWKSRRETGGYVTRPQNIRRIKLSV